MNEFTALPSLSDTIQRFGLSAKKALGQHFLLDGGITREIAANAGDLKQCNTIEIGPGPGGLTRSLLAAGAKHVFAIEKDERCLTALAEIKAIAGERLTILPADALEVDLMQTVQAPRKIVANLPYNIATVLLLQWLEAIYHDAGAFESMTLMFQKEVADRIAAEHGNKNYGRLSVISQWLCDVRHDMDLPPEAFSPPPKVSSSVITLTPRAKPLVDVKLQILELVVGKAFNQRRKMLRQSLKGLTIPAETLLKEAGIDGTLRVEQLDVYTLCSLAKVYEKF